MEDNNYFDNNSQEYNPDDRYARISDMYNEMEGNAQTQYHQEEQAMEQRKKRVHLITAVAVAACVLIAAVGIATPFIKNNSGKARLAKAVKNFSADLEASKAVSSEEYAEILNSLYYGDATTSYSLNISGIPNVPVTLGVDGQLGRSFDSKEMSSENSISVMNAHVADFNVYADDTEVYLIIPDIFEETFMFETEGFAEKFNNSYIAQLAGAQIPDTVELRPFGDGEKKNIRFTDWESINDGCRKELSTAGTHAVINKDKQKISYTISDSSQVNVTSFHVTLNKDDVNQLMDAYVNQMYLAGLLDTVTEAGEDISQNVNELKPGQSIVPELGTTSSNELADKLKAVEVQSDIKLEIFVDSDNQIRYITNDEPVIIDGYAIELHFSFDGADSCVENQTLAINVSNGETEGDEVDGSAVAMFNGETYMATLNTDTDGKKTINLSMQGDVNMSTELIEKIEYKGKVLSADFDKIAFYYNNENVLQMSGTIQTLVDQAQIKKHPNGKVMDLLDLNLMDIITIAGELTGKYGDISGLLGGLGL